MDTSVETLAELEAEARRFLATLAPRTDTATLVTLSGELGAGKTAYVQAVAKALGVEGTVSSPTFVLLKVYALPAGGSYARLAHIDAYRLEKGADLRPLGFDDLMKDPSTLVLLEWPERVADGLPVPAARIALSVLPEAARSVRYE
jgi:tRNA threonylcarbamoyladenosine biosynthesis protein TsaE